MLSGEVGSNIVFGVLFSESLRIRALVSVFGSQMLLLVAFSRRFGLIFYRNWMTSSSLSSFVQVEISSRALFVPGKHSHRPDEARENRVNCKD